MSETARTGVKPEQEAPTYTNKTLGIGRTEKGKYGIYVINFNPLTNEVGPLECYAIEDSRDGAEQRFKIETVKQGIFK